MRSARKLRVVPDCPQPDPPAYRPVVYGQAPWSRLPHNPTADQLTVRCRVQSARSVGGIRAELLSYEDSLAWEREHQSMPASAPSPCAQTPSSRIACEAGAFPVDHRDLPNMTPEQWEEWEAAFGPEPNFPEDY